jgi:hypothetical protein
MLELNKKHGKNITTLHIENKKIKRKVFFYLSSEKLKTVFCEPKGWGERGGDERE